jgi:hypothetical protein
MACQLQNKLIVSEPALGGIPWFTVPIFSEKLDGKYLSRIIRAGVMVASPCFLQVQAESSFLDFLHIKTVLLIICWLKGTVSEEIC